MRTVKPRCLNLKCYGTSAGFRVSGRKLKGGKKRRKDKLAPRRNRKQYNDYMKEYMKEYRKEERELLRKAKLNYGWDRDTPNRRRKKKS